MVVWLNSYVWRGAGFDFYYQDWLPSPYSVHHCNRLNNDHWKTLNSNQSNLWMLPYEKISLPMQLSFLRQGDYLGLSAWSFSQITVVLTGEAEGGLSHGEEEKAVCPLRQRLQWGSLKPKNASATRNLNEQGMEFSLETPK